MISTHRPRNDQSQALLDQTVSPILGNHPDRSFRFILGHRLGNSGSRHLNTPTTALHTRTIRRQHLNILLRRIPLHRKITHHLTRTITSPRTSNPTTRFPKQGLINPDFIHPHSRSSC